MLSIVKIYINCANAWIISFNNNTILVTVTMWLRAGYSIVFHLLAEIYVLYTLHRSQRRKYVPRLFRVNKYVLYHNEVPGML